MNHYKARQVDPASGRPDAGKWRYTCENDGRIWTSGACSRFQTCTACDGHSAISTDPCSTCNGRGFTDVGECPGHDTPDEAYIHQTDWLLSRTRFDQSLANEQRRCQVCGEWTQGLASVDHYSFVLCDGHRTREHVAALFGGAGESWGSW